VISLNELNSKLIKSKEKLIKKIIPKKYGGRERFIRNLHESILILEN
jgi:hypothetical protein